MWQDVQPVEAWQEAQKPGPAGSSDGVDQQAAALLASKLGGALGAFGAGDDVAHNASVRTTAAGTSTGSMNSTGFGPRDSISFDARASSAEGFGYGDAWNPADGDVWSALGLPDAAASNGANGALDVYSTYGANGVPNGATNGATHGSLDGDQQTNGDAAMADFLNELSGIAASDNGNGLAGLASANGYGPAKHTPARTQSGSHPYGAAGGETPGRKSETILWEDASGWQPPFATVGNESLNATLSSRSTEAGQFSDMSAPTSASSGPIAGRISVNSQMPSALSLGSAATSTGDIIESHVVCQPVPAEPLEYRKPTIEWYQQSDSDRMESVERARQLAQQTRPPELAYS